MTSEKDYEEFLHEERARIDAELSKLDDALPLPDPDVAYLLTDEIMLCPKCQSRTDWEDVEELKQVHTCRNPDCRYIFFAEWDPEELDADGNWVDPSSDWE